MRLKPRLFRKPRKGHWATKGLVGLWLMNEGSGNKVFDLSGNSYVGTLNDITWVAGQSGPATSYPNTNGDYINIPCAAGSSADLTGQGTIIARVKPNGVSGSHSIFGRTIQQMWLFQNNDDYLFRVTTGSTVLSAMAVFTAGEFHTVAVTYDDVPGDAHFYKNGILHTSDLGNAINMASSAAAWHIGEDPRDSLGVPYDGLIEYVMLWNRVLSASEIAELYINPFIMFERDPIELYAAATLGGGAPAGVNAAGQADIVISSLAGFRRLNRPGAAQADIVTSSLAGFRRLNRPGAGAAAIVTSSLSGMTKTWNAAAQASIVTSSLAGMRRLNRPGAAQAAINIQTFAGATGGAAVTTLEEIFRYRRYRDAGVFRRRNLKGVY